MDKYYEWIKEVLKDENVDLDSYKTSTDPRLLNHIHEAVRDLHDALENIREDLNVTEQNIFSNKCEIHGDQWVISDSDRKSSDEIDQTKHSSSKKKHEIQSKKLKERHISTKTRFSYLGLPTCFLSSSDESESPDSSDLEEIQKKCKQLQERYKLLHHKKAKKTENKPTRQKSDSTSQTTSEAQSTAERLPTQSHKKESKRTTEKVKHDKSKRKRRTSASQTISDVPDSPSKASEKTDHTKSHKSIDEKNTTARRPPTPTQYVEHEQLDQINDCNSKSQLASLRLLDELITEPFDSILSSTFTTESTVYKKRDENKHRKKHKPKRKDIPKTDTAVQTSHDKEQQNYAKSRLLRSERPKSARPERRLLHLNTFMCLAPETKEADISTDETIKITKTTTDDDDEIQPSQLLEIKQFAPEIKDHKARDLNLLARSSTQKFGTRSKSCPRESISDQTPTIQISTETTDLKQKQQKNLKSDFSSQTDLTKTGIHKEKSSIGVQFSCEDLLDIEKTIKRPNLKKDSGSQTDLTEEKPIGILKRTFTDPSIKRLSGQKPKFVSIVDSGSQTNLDRFQIPTDYEYLDHQFRESQVNESTNLKAKRTSSESQTDLSVINQIPHYFPVSYKVDGDSQTSLEDKTSTTSTKYKYLPGMQQVTSTTSNMAARIDLHIKVSSNVQVDGNSSETANDSDSTKDDKSKEKTDKFKKADTQSHTTTTKPSNLLKEETLTVDNQKLTIRVISEENLCVSQSNDGEIDVKRSSTENLDIEKPIRSTQDSKQSSESKHLDIDDVSINSMSEGDNSVFTDGQCTPTDPEIGAVGGDSRNSKQQSIENQEEVDDIELIFSSDENKDYTQEDLVSISEYEPWKEPDGTGTPIMVKFNKKNVSIEKTQMEENKGIKQKLKSQNSSSQTNREGQQKSLDSVESFSYNVIHVGEDPTIKKCSLDKDSSLEQEAISRDESFDTFEQALSSTIQRRWTRASILVETDISKCGISEELTEETLMGFPRRNTCPNPAPYR